MDRISNHVNLDRAQSDHNLIGVNIALKKIRLGGQNIGKRKWNKFDKERYLEKIKKLDFSELYEMTDPELANSYLENKLRTILDSEAPMGIVQVRTKYLKWLSPRTKELMDKRDKARNIARNTQSDNDWENYRVLRNNCSKEQRLDRTAFLDSTYKKIEGERDTSRLYTMTRQLLGWKSSGPPTCLFNGDKRLRKQKEIANSQAQYYTNKIKKIKNSLPQVRSDPLKFLKRAHQRWVPSGRIPELELKKSDPGRDF